MRTLETKKLTLFSRPITGQRDIVKVLQTNQKVNTVIEAFCPLADDNDLFFGNAN